MTRHRINLTFILLGMFALQTWLLAPSAAHAGGTIKIDDDRSVSVGMGLRSSFNMIEDAAPNGEDRSKDFALDNFRFYLSGQLHKGIAFEFNTDYDTAPAGTEDIRVLDGVLKFGFNDYVNIWVGRFLPPSDRSNLSGPYYLNSWDFPFVQMYPAVFAGRDDGAALFGQIGGGMFKYQVGAFEGLGDTTGGPNQKDNLLYAGRLTLNLWDPEPGYYNSSTYYGAKNVLAIGLAAMNQTDAVGTAAAPGDFKGWNVDLLVERNLGSAGVATLEGAYYDYDNDGLAAEGDGY
ncbi:MAG TPA: porin, partial [Candidatus Manganitrophaceae bacterium]|nr:porin [Candidatus Manganitrophaceae bacterium]